MTLLVFGSINMDLVAQTPRLPAPAETIIGHRFFTAPGGKGANQAVAAARLNIPVKIIGRVGGDGFGAELRQNLEAVGVDTAGIVADAEVSSGVAIIAVDDSAENSIILVPGANGRVDQSDVDRLAENLPGTQALLLQLEVPLEATISAAKLAREQDVTVILDPAPARDLPPELYRLVNIITPNEVEAAQLVGFAVNNPDDAFKAADILLDRGVQTAVVKMGAQGVAFADRGGERGFIPAFEIAAVDTVAAGDAFNGGLAAALIEGHALPEALRRGAAVGALSATKPGAQPSMPSRAEFDQFLRDHA